MDRLSAGTGGTAAIAATAAAAATGRPRVAGDVVGTTGRAGGRVRAVRPGGVGARGRLGRALGALALLLLASPASASLTSPSAAAPEAAERPWRVEVGAGATLLLTAQSLALPHLVRASGEVAVRRAIGDGRLVLGVAVAGLVGGGADYRLLGGLVTVDLPLLRGRHFDFGPLAGFGAGTGPRVLASDLVARSAVVPWARLGLAVDWHVSRGFGLRVSARGDHLTGITVALAAGLSL